MPAIMKTLRSHSGKILFYSLLLASCAFAPLTSRAVITFTFEEVGADVVITGSGSWDTIDIPMYSTTPVENSVISPGLGTIQFGKPGGTVRWYTYQVSDKDAFFGTGNYNLIGGATTGDTFSWTGQDISLPGDSGTFSGSVTYAGQTFASLGINPNAGTQTMVTWDNGAQSAVFSIVPSAVPEPATVGLLLGGAALVGCVIMRSRRRRVAA